MTIIKLRRGLAALWTSVNPILSEGEMGVELDTRRFKFGDGVKRWRDLQYAGDTSELSIEIAARIAGDEALDIRLDALEAASSGFGGGGNLISAGTQLAPAGSTVLFSNANGVTFGLSNSSVLTASVAAGLPSPVNFSAGLASADLGSVVFSNSNGVSFGLNGSTITAAHNGLTSQSNQAFSADASSTFQTLTFQNSNGVSFSNNAGAIRVTHDLMFSTSRPAFSAGAASSTFQTLQFQDSLNLSFSNNAGSVRVSHNLAGTSTGFAGANISGSVTLNSSGMNLSFSVAAPGGAAITQSIGISTQTAGGSTAGTSGYATGDDILYHLVPGSNITMSQSLNGASATLSIYGAAGGGGGATISSYENMPGGLWGTSAVTFGFTSLSSAVAFMMPQAGSFSFLRIPVLMTMGSTTIATIASATASAQMGQTSTFNAVVYSVGIGASSKSLMSVASGSGTVNLSGRISITNSTQGSYTLAYSGLVEGGGTTRTTQYSVSNTNYSFTSQAMSEFSSNRFLDIPFANSLSAGAYWLVVGRSTSSSSAGAALSAITSWGPRYSNHYAATQGNLLFGVMGSTDLTSIGGLIGAGNFSTAGGGTTSALPMSAISSTASNPRMYFQLLRSA